MDGAKEQRLMNFINLIASIMIKLKLNLSELIQIVKEDHIIKKLIDSVKREMDNKYSNEN